MSEELFKQCAYHESGHIVMAYLSRYKTDSVTLLENEPGSGFTKFDYGDFNMLITAILNFHEHPDVFHSLQINEKNISPDVAFKINGVLLGGPLSEALYLSGVDFEGNLPVEMGGPDLKSVLNVDLFLSKFDKNHPSDYVVKSLSSVANLLKQKEVWGAIEHLANTILTAPQKKLNKQEVENSLRESGYFEFIK